MKVSDQHLAEVRESVKQRNKARRGLQRAELELEEVVEAALAATGAQPGASISLETGEITPPAAAG